MSYSPVSHKRPYMHDSSSDYAAYPSGFPNPPSHSMHNHSLNHSNPPPGPQLGHPYSHLYSGALPPPQAHPSDKYNYANTPPQQYPNRPYDDSCAVVRGYPPAFSSKERVNALEPQFRLSSNHYNEISNRCDEIIGILSKFDRSDAGDTNQLVDSAKALYDVFLTAEQRTSPSQSPVPTKSSEKPKKRTKSNQAKLYCHSCNCTDTPEWRKGPLGPRTLCNACGLIWAKLSKKKAKEAQMTAKNGKSENDTSDSRSNSVSTTNDASHGRNGNDTRSLPTESREEKPDDKKLTLSFLLS
ncbi:hypothetical protein K493DRAFT_334925 [Basidiobolus meristosporus CBS 931.73]|uniref:GATA-type domain-containing protein n=1 Tax=Basidiobolus meristosporus CBS 931.73 TaxID=1314790 RepID=A0A1Y1YU40_9FUNG|nr:hypothetical protein K493DRAFT_334925 [Basidiobolus meristosporus CBS 931.73]|eukprot:ORY01548.1 hypothetical protein K493DRAFT_334925 [Basidiobolus meristosporus CBS 931.73]